MDNYDLDEDDTEDWNQPLEKQEINYGNQKCNKQDKHQRVIVHIDIDCFYAQVEMIRKPGLRDKPLGIQQKNIIVTCNYPARSRGVTKLSYIKDALERCPELVLVNGEDLTHYREMSYRISNFFLKYCPLIERLGFDENFLDVTDLVQDRLDRDREGSRSSSQVKGHMYYETENYGSQAACSCGCHERLVVGSQVAADIREALYTELGITCCAGIAHNKLLSKLVAGTHKPNQQTTLFPGDSSKLLNTLDSVRNIPGIGHSSAKRLKDLGIVSVCDLQQADSSLLEEVFGHAAMETMKNLCNGIDTSPVIAFGLPQSLSDEDSFKKCSTVSDMRVRIYTLLMGLLHRLLKDGRLPLTFRVTIRKLANQRYSSRESRQCPIPAHIFSKFSEGSLSTVCKHLEDLAVILITKMLDTNESFHLTLINVAFTKLEQKSDNMITNFFSPKSVPQISRNPPTYMPETSHEVTVDLFPSSEDQALSESTGSAQVSAESNPVWEMGSGSLKVSPKSTRERNDTLEGNETFFKGVQKRRSGLLTWFVKSPQKNMSQDSDVKCFANQAASERIGECSDSVKRQPDKSEDKDCHERVMKTSQDSYISGKRKSGDAFKDIKLSKKMKCASSPCPSTSRVGNLDCTAEQIPDGIDKTVFFELPESIQQELLKNPRNITEAGISGSRTLDSTTNNNKQDTAASTTDSRKPADSHANSNLHFTNITCSRTSRPSSATSSISEILCNKKDQSGLPPVETQTSVKNLTFLPKSSCSSLNNNKETVESMMISESTATAVKSREVKQHFSLQSGVAYSPVTTVNTLTTINTYKCSKEQPAVCANNIVMGATKPDKTDLLISSSDVRKRNPETCEVPQGIDRTVFMNLPEDIQKEILDDWKRNAGHKNIIPHCKSPKPSSANNILSYFSKK